MMPSTCCWLGIVFILQGPFVGAIGFSQGAGLAAILASVLEPNRGRPEEFKTSHPPLKFGIAYCGFKAPNPEFQWMYEPKIQTPILNVLGSLDTVVDDKLARALVDACDGNRVLWHPGNTQTIASLYMAHQKCLSATNDS